MNTNEQINHDDTAYDNMVLPVELDFGDYCTIEQHRYGCDNEHYITQGYW